jgi:hypothetical protein
MSEVTHQRAPDYSVQSQEWTPGSSHRDMSKTSSISTTTAGRDSRRASKDGCPDVKSPFANSVTCPALTIAVTYCIW